MSRFGRYACVIRATSGPRLIEAGAACCAGAPLPCAPPSVAHSFYPGLVGLRRTRGGLWAESAPALCPNGHKLEPGRVLVGWESRCEVPHRVWTCRECGADARHEQ